MNVKTRRVLHFKTGPYLPMTENWIYGQISNLRRYEPIVYACAGVNQHLFPVDTIRLMKFNESTRNEKLLCKLLFYPYFLYWSGRDRPDVAHAHFGPSGQRFLVLNHFLHIPLITSFYGYDVNQLVNTHPAWFNKYQILFRMGTCFLVEGPHMKESLVVLGCPDHKIIIHHLGVDLENIKPAPRKIGENEELKVMIAASFREKKGIPYGVEAFGLFKGANPQTKATLTIIGDTSDNPQENEQKRLILAAIERHNLGGSVTMLGYQTHEAFMRELYRHHIFLSPSIHASDGDNEGGAPVSIIEASASGMPVLATRHCDIPEVIIDGKNGYLVPERDSSALADKLAFLAFNSNIWSQMGIYGRLHIEQHYDVKRQTSVLEDIYDAVVDNRHAKK